MRSRRKEFYVYALLDPRRAGPFYYGHWKFSHEPFYIGKGKAGRAHSHFKETILEREAHLPKTRKILGLKRLGLAPLVVFKKKNLTDKQACLVERALIQRIGRRNLRTGPLTNLTDGGEGHSGFSPSAETVEKHRRHFDVFAFDGRSLTLGQWASEYGISRQLIRRRLNNGWSVAEAITSPAGLVPEKYKRKAAVNRKRAWASKSAAEKGRISEKLKIKAAARTPAQLSLRATRVRETLAKLSNDERMRRSKNQSRISLAMWQARSSHEREVFSRKVSLGVTKQHKRLGHRIQF